MPITDTVRAILITAAARSDHLALLPDRLPTAARRAVAQSMLRAELIEEIAATDDEQQAWRTTDDSQRFCLRVTRAGLDAIGVMPNAVVEPAPTVSARLTIRVAAQALLLAWDDADAGRPALPAAIHVLRTALTGSRRSAAGPRQLRPDTKRAAVLALLSQPGGATVAQVVEATGWARHTVHGFFAGLKKAGMQVAVLERVRQAGPGKQGTAGSYTVYHIAEAS